MMPNNSNIDEMIKYTQELYAKEKGNNYAEHFKKKHGGNFYREILTATALATNKKLSQKTETLYKEDFNDLVSLAATLLREKINIPDNLAIFLADFL